MAENTRDYPRVLIIGNECLSKSSSNGRTLRNFLIGWPKNSLAQFSVLCNDPDFEICGNYFCTSDAQALRAFLGKECAGGQLDPKGQYAVTKSAGKKRKRNAMNMLLREMVWNSRRWTKNGFWQWADAYRPQLVLLQAGDCGFMFRLAEDVAERYDIPLVIYNSEGYYFHKFDYFRGKGLAHWCYPLFHRCLCRQIRKTVKRAVCSVYICKPLQNDFDAELGLPSHTIYTATGLAPAEKKENGSELTISYLGNFGVGRHEPLVEIATVLQSISPNLFLDVYGRIPNDIVQSAFDACPGIRCKGFVPYERVVEIMHQSDILVHGENFSGFYRRYIKYGFSTKLADSLASGTCFLLYAPEEMACTRYLKENEAAWVVSDRSALTGILTKLVKEPAERRRYIENAIQLVRENHSEEMCTAKFQNVLRNAVKE